MCCGFTPVRRSTNACRSAMTSAEKLSSARGTPGRSDGPLAIVSSTENVSSPNGSAWNVHETTWVPSASGGRATVTVTTSCNGNGAETDVAGHSPSANVSVTASSGTSSPSIATPVTAVSSASNSRFLIANVTAPSTLRRLPTV
jgi:hypothetical protein